VIVGSRRSAASPATHARASQFTAGFRQTGAAAFLLRARAMSPHACIDDAIGIGTPARRGYRPPWQTYFRCM